MQVCSAKHSVLEISLGSVHKINSHSWGDYIIIFFFQFSVLIKMQVCSAKHSVLEISLGSVHKINSHSRGDYILIFFFIFQF